MKYVLVTFNACSKNYCFKVDDSIELNVGDLVVCGSKTNFDLAVVEEVDHNPANPERITAWIVQKVDLVDYNKRMEAIKRKDAIEAVFNHRKELFEKRAEYTKLAEIDPVSKELLDEYNRLVFGFDL